jgi:hypothetical protein
MRFTNLRHFDASPIESWANTDKIIILKSLYMGLVRSPDCTVSCINEFVRRICHLKGSLEDEINRNDFHFPPNWLSTLLKQRARSEWEYVCRRANQRLNTCKHVLAPFSFSTHMSRNIVFNETWACKTFPHTLSHTHTFYRHHPHHHPSLLFLFLDKKPFYFDALQTQLGTNGQL